MGVVKRGLVLQRLCHCFMRRSRDFSEIELSAHSLPDGALGRGAAITRKHFFQKPKLKLLLRLTFVSFLELQRFKVSRPKVGCFVKVRPPAVRKALCQLNIEVSSLQSHCRSSTHRQA